MNTSYEKYQYHNLPIPGGGYVTGFIFHPKKQDILYIRTDIGGTYRYDYSIKRWKGLIPHVTMFDLRETYPIAVGLDANKPERLLTVSGVNDENRKGLLSISDDYGDTYRYEEMPVYVHGNLNGRGVGLRLVVDESDGNTLYFASQKDGLCISHDLGKTWTVQDICGEKHLTFVFVEPSTHAIVVGTAGYDTRESDMMRGTSLYVSYDNGVHFEPMNQPKNHEVMNSKMSGYVAQRYDFDGKYLYITLSNTGARSYTIEHGYSCDCGDVLAGRVLRYEFLNGRFDTYKDITPNCMLDCAKESDYPFGFSGISSCKSKEGLLVSSTICKDDGDMVFVSKDYGESWKVALYDLSVGKLEFKTSYMKPEFNGGVSLLHWLSDIKINPFNPNEVWFNSGTGVFMSENLLDDVCVFHDQCEGIEETVHLNLYSPTGGEVLLIDILGDLGGFAFRKLNEPCINSFADDNGNRYITCINADFADNSPEKVVVTARGNWTGKTKGGLIYSQDDCKTFTRLNMPYGLSENIDKLCRRIENPNNNAGWVAINATSDTIVWTLADNIDLPIDCVVVTHDFGASYQKVKVTGLDGKIRTTGKMKVFSDRVNPDVFYGFGEESELFISTDRGETFVQKETPEYLPKVEFGLIDCANKTEIRGNAGFEGDFYLALGMMGLWRMNYDVASDTFEFELLSDTGEMIYRLGLGIAKEEDSYIGRKKTIYVCGVINDEYGFFRSDDEAKSWVKVNSASQMFGDINSIEGDSRTYGRFFIATGSVGVLYAEPADE